MIAIVKQLGPSGQFACGLCSRQISEAFICKYPVCLCDACIRMYRVVEPASEAHLGGIHAAAPQTNFKTLLYEKRGDLMLHLIKALEDMNSLEDVKQRARGTERQLEESRQEVERLRQERDKLIQQGGGHQVHEESGLLAAKMNELFEKMETKQTKLKELEDQCSNLTAANHQLFVQNQDLNNQVQRLTDQLTNAERTLTSQQELKIQMKRFEEQLSSMDLATQIKVCLADNLPEVVKAVTQKLSDVMPLITHIKMNESWLDAEGMKSLRDLATLVVQDQVEPEPMWKMARVCANIAKLLGPCTLVPAFVTAVCKKLRINAEEGQKLLKRLNQIYVKTLGQESANKVLKGFLELVTQEGEVFDESFDLVAYMSEVLLPDQFCDFGVAVTSYLQERKGQDWCANWSRLPTKEQLGDSPSEIAPLFAPMFRVMQEGLLPHQLVSQISDLFREMLEHPQLAKFSALVLTQLNAGDSGLHFANMLTGMQKVITQANLPNAIVFQLCELCLLASINKSQVTQIFKFSTWIYRQEVDNSQVIREMLSAIRRESHDLVFQLAELCLLADTRKPHDLKILRFSTSVLQHFQSGDTNFAAMITEMIRVLNQANLLHDIVFLIAELCVLANPRNPKDLQFFRFSAYILQQLQPDDPETDYIQVLTRMVKAFEQETFPHALLFQLSEMCNLGFIRKPQDPEIVRFSAAVLQQITIGALVSDRSSAVTDVLSTLKQADFRHDLVNQLCEICNLAHAKLPIDTQLFVFSSFVIKQLQLGRDPTVIENFLTELQITLSQDSIHYSVAFELTQLYIKYSQQTVAASTLLTTRLVDLRRLSPSESMDGLLRDIGVILSRLSPKDAMNFIKTDFQSGFLNPIEILKRPPSPRELAEKTGAVKLVKELSLHRDFDDVCELFDLTCSKPTGEVIIAVTYLASVITALVNLGHQVPAQGHKLEPILHQDSAGLGSLFKSLKKMLDKHGESGPFALQLLDTLPNLSHELVSLLEFVPQLLIILAESVDVGTQGSVTFCQTVLMDCFKRDYIDLLKKLQLEPERLVKLYKTVHGQVTMEDLKVHFGFMLVTVQTQSMRLFDCLQQTWGNDIPLQSGVNADEYSCYTFLDNEKVFFCGGGQIYVAFRVSNRKNGGHKETYILNRSTREATKLLPLMNVARAAHGILFYSKSNVIYVFGGCNWLYRR